jgi:hypothetical protein
MNSKSIVAENEQCLILFTAILVHVITLANIEIEEKKIFRLMTPFKEI